MQRVNIKCPYCRSQAFLRPASVVYGQGHSEPNTELYVCARYPICDAYVAAHRHNHLPMGTLANRELLQQRQSAKATPLEEIQLSLFPDVSDRSLDTAC